MKKFSKFFIFLVLICCTLVTGINIEAKSSKKYVIVGGNSIGLNVETGIYVTGKFDVDGKKPWKGANIEVNDIIIKCDNIPLTNISELKNLISKKIENDEIELTINRKGKEIVTKTKVIKDITGKNSIGLYVKDEIIGIGTLTYIDPIDMSFGALGHSISDNLGINSVSGNIYDSIVSGVKKSVPGTPGEKRATIESNVIGSVVKNNSYGLYGKFLSSNYDDKNLMEVGEISKIKLGKAKILTVTSNNEIDEYEIEIVDLKNQLTSNIKGIKFRVSDKNLLSKAGGIIQGMSGSPIIQDNKIIGAVSHVIVDNPEYGYGVYLEWMLKNK